MTALKTRKHRWRYAILLAGFILSCAQGGEDAPDVAADTAERSPVEGALDARANGERIYRSATSRSVPIITSTGETRPDGTPLLSCADCHGARGLGRMLRVGDGGSLAPAITFDALTVERTKGGFPAYTEVTFGLTLRTGVTPDGRKLDSLMPRWRMSAQDQKDLFGYLKSLSPAPGDLADP